MAFFDLSQPELESYRPAVAEPEDFDDFWRSTLAEARTHDLDVRTELVDARLSLVDVHDLTFRGHGGQDVRGWYMLPAGASEPLPTVVQFHGYSGGRGMPQVNQWVAAGHAYLALDTRGQGWASESIFPGTPDEGATGTGFPGQMTEGILDPETYYYRRLFTDCVRLLDVARSLPQVDASKLYLQGGSQGGGMTIAAAGLAALDGIEVAGAMPDVPFLCHFERAITLTDAHPYKEVSEFLRGRPREVETVARTLSYFDGVNFAKRAKCPTLFSVALMDQICPPSTVYAAFNQWGHDDRTINVYPHNGHEGGRAIQAWEQLGWLRDHLGQDAEPVQPRRGLRRLMH